MVPTLCRTGYDTENDTKRNGWFLKQLGDTEDYFVLNRQLFDCTMAFDAFDEEMEYQVLAYYISGTDDWICPMDSVNAYVDAIHVPNKELFLLEGCGHNVQYALPEKFGEIVCDCGDHPSDHDGQQGMIPYDMSLTGAHGGYLFIPIDGNTYRYAMSDLSANNYTKANLIYEFTEEGFDTNYEHSIYRLSEYSDDTVLCDICKEQGGDMMETALIEYRPVTGASSDELDMAMNSGYVIMEDGSVTSGKDKWISFYEKTAAGKSASVRLVKIYNLDRNGCSEELYEAAKYDYPALFFSELEYDGIKYIIRPLHYDGNEYSYSYLEGYDNPVQEWKYLMHYTGEPESSTALFSTYDRYVLVNDDTVTWKDIEWGMISSQFGDYIPYEEVFNEYVWK